MDVFTVIIGILFLWSVYHVIRDILQDLLHIPHPLIDVFHKPQKRNLPFLGSFNKLWSLPIVSVMTLSPIAFFLTDMLLFGVTVIILFALFLIVWGWTVI